MKTYLLILYLFGILGFSASGQLPGKTDPVFPPSMSVAVRDATPAIRRSETALRSLSTAQRLALDTLSPATRMMLVYDTGTRSYWHYDGKWMNSGTPSNPWDALGNSGMDSASNFVGTTDKNPLIFRTNNQEHMRIGSGGDVTVSGFLQADSARINGPLVVTSNGGSFQWTPNVLLPAPSHDRVRVSTQIYTVMGGTIVGTNWFPAPLKYMGVNTETPVNMLDVFNGDIDVFSPTNNVGYKLGNQYVLRHKGNVSNIFVGVNAALNASTLSGKNNTIVGYDAANISTSIGNQNTAVGSESGANLQSVTHDNTFMGYHSGYNFRLGIISTFLGSEAGFSQAIGDENVYLGFRSGYNSNNCAQNTFAGNLSGQNNSSGAGNTFIGMGSGGGNSTGNSNVALGLGAGPGPLQPNLQGSAAIGTGSQTMNSNQMILGANTVNVGIGLSGDPSGPLNKLEIKASAAGLSGLRFRQLNSTYAPIPNPGLGVLALSTSGDVIYVPAAAGSVSVCTSPGPLTNNVTKFTTGSTICRTNITDLYPVNNVGINFLAPTNALDIGLSGGNGNLNVNNTGSSYKLGNTPILWHKGNTSNLFVGVNAGANLTSGNDNTFVGSGAASVSTAIGNKNTMVGSATGTNLSLGLDNTFMGYHAGFNYTFGNNSTFIGSGAGFNENFDEDVYIGWHAGFNSTSSLHCTFVGNGAGLSTLAGYQDVFIGIGSGGANVNGANNVALGGAAGPSLPNLQNAIAIGDASVVTGSNEMILGNSNVKVGVGLSGITPGPSNWLEINTPASSPSAAASGLRFRDLTAASPTTANPGPGLLAVDNNGDVIYVAAPSGGGSLGNDCSSPANPLTADHEIPLNTFDFNFSGDGTNNQKVNVGFPCFTPNLPGKFNVTTNFQSDPSSTNDSYSIYGTNTFGGLFSNNTGIYGSAISTGTGTHETGVWGVASGDRQAIGVHGQAGVVSFPGGPAYGGYFEAVTAGNTFNNGVESVAANAPDNLAVEGIAYGGANSNTGAHGVGYGSVTTNGGIFEAWGGTVTNIGVTGRAFPSIITNPSTYPTMVNIGVYGQGPLTPTSGTIFGFAGYFDGDVWINGPATGTGFAVTSDQQFKTRVDTITDALKIIRQLKPKTFYYKTQNNFGMHFSDKRQYGVIAQDVEKVLPELVVNTHKPAMVDSSGRVVSEGVDFKAVNYDAFIGILIRSVQQLQAQNEKQDSLIRLLTAALNPGGNHPGGQVNNPDKLINQSAITLSDEDIIVLNQNVPNPFSEQTSITWYLPQGISVAKIMFYNSRGQMIKVSEITGRGDGRLKVYANDLSTGMYTYTLVADGKIIDTKKMMKEK